MGIPEIHGTRLIAFHKPDKAHNHVRHVTEGAGLRAGPVNRQILVSKGLTNEIADHIKAGDHASTFGGGPLACAAAKATLEVVKQNKLVQNAKEIEEYIRKEIPNVLGKGLLLGIPVDDQSKALSKLLSSKIIAGSSANPKSIRLLPPLILQKNHIDKFLEALRK